MKVIKYSDPNFSPFSDKIAIYKGKMYETVEDLKRFPNTITLKGCKA